MPRHDGAVPVPLSEKLLLKPFEAASLCSIGLQQAKEYIRRGEQNGGWRSIQTPGGHYLIPRRWLETWVEDEAARQSAG